MAVQIVAAPIVKWIFSTAIGGLFGSGGGTPLARNRLFGPIADALFNRAELGTLGTVGTPPLNPSAPPRPLPGFPGGVSIPDRIPPRVGVSGTAAAVARSILRGGWVGAIFYPSNTAADDTLCIRTQYGPWCPPGMPNAAPVAVPLPRPGRRSRPRVVPGTSPRRRERGRVAAPPAIPAPRGRPMTISRPRVVAEPRVISQPMPAPRSLPPPAASFPLPRSGSAPASIPTTAAHPLLRALPAIARVVLPSLGSWVNTGTAARAIPGAATIPSSIPTSLPLPGISPRPGIGPQPLPELALAPLTSYARAVAQSPAQDLDDQCRTRAKQKRKKRKPRNECWKGSYTETRKGTLKHRRKKIPCR